ADALGELHREPAAAGAEIGDRRSFGDAQRVHDLLGLLPVLPIRRFEQTEILRLKKLGPGAGGRGPCGERRRCRERRQESRDHERLHFFSASPRSPIRPAAPTMPPRVIASTDRIASSLSLGSRPRSSTMSRMVLPVFTDSFAISAVAA